MKSGIQGEKSEIQGVESGMQGVKSGIQGLKSGIQGVKFGIQGVKSGIQRPPGLPHIGRRSGVIFLVVFTEVCWNCVKNYF